VRPTFDDVEPFARRCAVVVAALLAFLPLASPASAREGVRAVPRVYWGAWVQGAEYGRDDPPWDMVALDRFEANAGKRVGILHFGQPWYSGGQPHGFYPRQLDPIRERGAIPLVDWASWDLAGDRHTQARFALRNIIAGRFDGYIRRWALDAKAWGHPFFLRFDHEMNGTWFPWSEGQNGNRRGEFVRAWRHVHRIFQEVGATNVTWVWSPVVMVDGRYALDGYYPGNAYVDWVAMDGYNWGVGSAKPYRWQSFEAVFAPTYRRLVRVAPTKPIMIAEVATTEHGGDKAAWIRNGLARLPTAFPRVRALVWHNKRDEGLDWPIESSTRARRAFARAIAAHRFAADEFGELAPGRITPP
jgi:hypothetical protein